MINEIRKRCNKNQENYAACYAYGTEKQKTDTAVELADYACEVLPFLLDKIEQMEKFHNEEIKGISEIMNKITSERCELKAELQRYRKLESESWLQRTNTLTGVHNLRY